MTDASGQPSYGKVVKLWMEDRASLVECSDKNKAARKSMNAVLKASGLPELPARTEGH